jgi:hypothetical protein
MGNEWPFLLDLLMKIQESLSVSLNSEIRHGPQDLAKKVDNRPNVIKGCPKGLFSQIHYKQSGCTSLLGRELGAAYLAHRLWTD